MEDSLCKDGTVGKETQIKALNKGLFWACVREEMAKSFQMVH